MHAGLYTLDLEGRLHYGNIIMSIMPLLEEMAAKAGATAATIFQERTFIFFLLGEHLRYEI